MASLFQTRELSTAFPNRSVVIESSCVKTVKQDLIIKLCIEFGVNGKLTRQVHIPVTGRFIKDVKRDIDEHKDSILEIIGYLEEANLWTVKSTEELFNRVLCEEHPLMFHAVRKPKSITFAIFGEGLHDLEIVLDRRKEYGQRLFAQKILVLQNALRKHLESIDNMSAFDTLQGALA